jgi:endonuclease/exonuclease/phosphatase family metal-dependent hydrolase
LRYISEYTLGIEDMGIKIYSVHLKAADTSSDRELRYLDAKYLRREILNNLPEGSEFVVCGDMNFYDSDEPAYQEFIMDQSGVSGENNIGRLQDYLQGSWQPFAHTQSTRTKSLGDGGSTGGLDDRFDFIFGSVTTTNDENMEFIENSYTSFGNDGNHLDLAITDPPDISIPSPATASDLMKASDHLPVYIEFEVIHPSTDPVVWIFN